MPDDVAKSDEAPFLLAGTKMTEGYGYMMVVAVGQHTFKGNIQRLLALLDDEPTSQQVRRTIHHGL